MLYWVDVLMSLSHSQSLDLGISALATGEVHTPFLKCNHWIIFNKLSLIPPIFLITVSYTNVSDDSCT